MKEISLNSSQTELKHILIKNGWMLEEDQIIHVETPGAGNMNVVLRITTQKGSIILKQSRAYVNKYPQIPAPIDRIEVENQFYELVHTSSCSPYLPKLLGFDHVNKLLFIEDLGRSSDYQVLYQNKVDLSQKDYVEILSFLHQLHHTSFNAVAARKISKKFSPPTA